jgi:peroxiredoxin
MPRRRVNLKLIGLAAVALVGALVGSELLRGYTKGVADEQFRSNHGSYTTPFRVGDLAPDFTLPDSSGKQRSLASLVHQDTMLCILCGCDRCRTMQTRLGIMLRSLGARAPKVVSVTSADAAADAAWLRDTKLEQVLLHDSKEQGKPVTELYRGHPCPRLFRLAADRRVTWIGPSPAQLRTLDALGESVARNLGYTIPSRGNR